MWGPLSSRTATLAAAALAFIVVCILPPGYMLWSVVRAPDPLATLWSALLDRRQQQLMLTTVVLGASTAGLATLVGGALGFLLARVALPFKAALRIALVAPAVIPPYVLALAWLRIGGRLAPTLGGAIVVLTAAFYPLSMLATEVGLRRIDPRLEEAALVATTPARMLRRISWPLALPSVTSAALIVFALAISEFSVPGLLRVRVFTTEVFSAFASLYDFGRATVLSLPLVMLSSMVASGAAIGLGHQLIASRRSMHGAAVDAFDGWKAPGTVVAGVVLLAVLVVPLAALAADALRSTSILPVISKSRDAVVTSLILSLSGATAVVALAMVLGYGRARADVKLGALLDVVWLVLFAMPSTVVGIGLIGVWNRPGVPASLYGTPAMLILVYLARFVPVAALVVAAAVHTVPESQEEASATAGAGWLRTMTRIVLPQIRLGLAAAWAVVFILVFGEVGASILVAPPGESTLPIRVYTLTANAPPGHVAALGLFQSVVLLCPLTCLGIVFARRRVE